MVKAEREHHALVKVALGIRVSGGDRHVIVTHGFKQRCARALRQALRWSCARLRIDVAAAPC